MALRELRIRGCATILEATLRPGDGFTVISGETGAGKSVCVTALRLALGGRVEGDPISAGADRLVVAAVFDGVGPAVTELLDAEGIAVDDLVTLSRELPREGRGSCRINGALVSQATLRRVGEILAEVTRQGVSARLEDHRVQRDLLDGFGGRTLAGLRDEMAAAHAEWRAAAARLEAARRSAATGAAELESARLLVADLEPLALRAGEFEGLQVEAQRLRRSQELIAASRALAETIAADTVGAHDQLAATLAGLRSGGAVDPEAAELGDRLDFLLGELDDLGRAAARHADAVICDEARLAAAEERLLRLDRVARRFGSIEEAMSALAAASRLVEENSAGGEGLTAMEAAATSARTRAAEVARSLSEARRAAARRLEESLTRLLRRLDLPHARVRIVVEQRPDPAGIAWDGATVACTASGADEVDFRLAGNRGGIPLPLDAGPSGGERSRFALALAAVANAGGEATLVLDEVDTGIGGETAARVGELLAAAGGDRQVLAVTHRAEIAARASSHLLVSKRDDGIRTSSSVDAVDGDARLREMARLLSGRVTRAALARAAELLDEGREQRRAG